MSPAGADFRPTRYAGYPLDFVTKNYVAGTPPYCTIGVVIFLIL